MALIYDIVPFSKNVDISNFTMHTDASVFMNTTTVASKKGLANNKTNKLYVNKS